MPNPNKPQQNNPNPLPTSDPAEGKYPAEESVNQDSTKNPTPKERAIGLVQMNFDLFLAGSTTSRQSADSVVKAIAECPEADRMALKNECKDLCSKLKMFSEMLFNEIVYHTSSIK